MYVFPGYRGKEMMSENAFNLTVKEIHQTDVKNGGRSLRWRISEQRIVFRRLNRSGQNRVPPESCKPSSLQFDLGVSAGNVALIK